MKIKKRITPIQCYFLLISLFMAFYWIACFVKNGEPFLYAFLTDTQDTSMDFFHSMDNARTGNPYLRFSNYPALALIFYRVLYRFVPLELRGENGYELRNNEMAQLVLILYMMLCIFAILHMIYCHVKLADGEKAWLCTILLLSNPILFVLERGNLILFSFVLTMFFCYYHDSKNAFVKEIAFLALAIAAALKIYPAIFGLILVKKHKWKETLRLIIYGLIAFFLPFVWYGGIAGLKTMIAALQYTSGKFLGYGINLSIYNIVGLVAELFNTSIDNNILLLITGVVGIVLILSFFKAHSTKNEWTALALLVMMVPQVSYFYSAVFLILPFVESTNELVLGTDNAEKRKKRRLSARIEQNMMLCSYAAILIPWGFGWIKRVSEYDLPTSWGMLIQYGAEIILLLICFKNIIFTTGAKRKGHKGGQKDDKHQAAEQSP